MSWIAFVRSPAVIGLSQLVHSIQSATFGIILAPHAAQMTLIAPERTCWANSARLNSFFAGGFVNI